MTLGPLDNLTPEQMLARMRELEAALAKCKPVDCRMQRFRIVEMPLDARMKGPCKISECRYLHFQVLDFACGFQEVFSTECLSDAINQCNHLNGYPPA